MNAHSPFAPPIRFNERAPSRPTISIEIEVSLTGDLTPYRPATYNDPAEGGEIEDLEVSGLTTEALVPAPLHERGSHPRGVWQAFDLLAGVDVRSTDVQRLFANIIEAHRRDAEQAIVDDEVSRAA